jgi:hypothetical protein
MAKLPPKVIYDTHGVEIRRLGNTPLSIHDLDLARAD